MAEALGWPDTQPSWEQLSALAANPAGWGAVKHPEWGKVNLQWPDPLTSTAGLGSTVAVYRDLAIGAEATDDLRRRLVTAHNAVNGATGNLSGALAALRASGASAPGGLKDLPIVPATEQEVVAFNAAKPAVEVAAIYPTEGWVVSEVPVLGLNGSWVSDEQRTASEAFADFVVGGKAQQALQTAGWRAARLDTTRHRRCRRGADGARVHPRPAEPGRARPHAAELDGARPPGLAARRARHLRLDEGGGRHRPASPASRWPRTPCWRRSRSSPTRLGSDLWTFSRAARGNDYRAVVPLGPLNRRYGNGTARDNIAAAVPRITAEGDTGLYDTTLAAVAAVRAGWQPGPNTVVLISDGKNEDPGSPDLRTTLYRLVDGADPSRPVEVVTIALGSGADAKALRNIAATTKGKAYTAAQPEDLESVFLTALTG